jgi:hypothetical protein
VSKVTDTPIGERIEDMVIKFVPPTNMMSGEQVSNRELCIRQIKTLLADTLRSVRLPEKFEPEMDSEGDKYLTDTKDGFNRGISEAQEAINQVIKEVETYER